MSIEIHQANGGYMFYCTTADRAFGPTMKSFEEAEAFSAYLHIDPRRVGLAELEVKWKEFQDQSESRTPAPPERIWLRNVERDGHRTWTEAAGHGGGEYEYVRTSIAPKGDVESFRITWTPDVFGGHYDLSEEFYEGGEVVRKSDYDALLRVNEELAQIALQAKQFLESDEPTLKAADALGRAIDTATSQYQESKS